MARRSPTITVRSINAPGLFAAEAIARLLIERERARPVLRAVPGGLPDSHVMPNG